MKDNKQRSAAKTNGTQFSKHFNSAIIPSQSKNRSSRISQTKTFSNAPQRNNIRNMQKLKTQLIQKPKFLNQRKNSQIRNIGQNMKKINKKQSFFSRILSLRCCSRRDQISESSQLQRPKPQIKQQTNEEQERESFEEDEESEINDEFEEIDSQSCDDDQFNQRPHFHTLVRNQIKQIEDNEESEESESTSNIYDQHLNIKKQMLVHKIKIYFEKGQIKEYMSHVLKKVMHNKYSQELELLDVIKSETRKYVSAEEFENFVNQLENYTNQKHQTFTIKFNSRSNEGEATFTSPTQRSTNNSKRTRSLLAAGIANACQTQEQPHNSMAQASQQPKKKETKDGQITPQAFKNCSQAVIEREKQLIAMHKLMNEEQIVQRHLDLERIRRRKIPNKNQIAQGQSGTIKSSNCTQCSHEQSSQQNSGQGQNNCQAANQQTQTAPTPGEDQQINSHSNTPQLSEAASFCLEVDTQQDFKSLICPLCFKFIHKCQTTVCGHSFCTKCIDEYLIIKKTCFVCDKTIRTTKGSMLLSCFSIDDVISQLISNSEDPDVKVQWEAQKCDHITWQLKKKIDKIEVNEKIDVRDTDYIWCIGTVRMVIESATREPIIAVHYEGWNMWYDEFLPLSSPRLARLGFYTDRDDIPRYKMRMIGEGNPIAANQWSQRGQMQAFIVNRIPQNNWGGKKTYLNGKGSNKKKMSVQEVANMSEEERRRYENSTLGDGLDDRLEDFFNKYQDVNYNNGNCQFSGVSRGFIMAQSQMGSNSNQPQQQRSGLNSDYSSNIGVVPSQDNQLFDPQNGDINENHQDINDLEMTAYDEAIEAAIERQNIQQLQQNIVHPVFLRNAMTILNAVGQGGQYIVNNLIGPQAGQISHHHHHVVEHHHHQAPANPSIQLGQMGPPAAPGNGGNHGNGNRGGVHQHISNLMRQISAIRQQAQDSRDNGQPSGSQLQVSLNINQSRPGDQAPGGSNNSNNNAS